MDIISADLQPSDSPPYYSCQAVHSPKDQMEKEGVGKVRGGDEMEEWSEGEGGCALPTPASKQYYASLQTLLKLPARQLAPLHR